MSIYNLIFFSFKGMTPLMTSAKEGNINIVNMLIHANSYVNLQGNFKKLIIDLNIYY